MNPSGDQRGVQGRDSLFNEGQLQRVTDTGVLQPTGTLDGSPDEGIRSDDTGQQFDHKEVVRARLRILKFALLGAVILTGLTLVGLRQLHRHKTGSNTKADASVRYSNTTIPLANISTDSSALSLQNTQTLSINGQLNVNNSVVLSPAARPKSAIAGQIYFDQTSHELSYYNGSSYVTLRQNAPAPLSVSSINSTTGAVVLGGGLTMSGNTLSNGGVLTLQGQAGNVSLTGGSGIAVSGTTLSNSGLLSLGGANGDITIGNGLSVSGNQLRNTGIISATGAGMITVTNDGNGNITIDGPGGGGGGGTVSSPGGTIGKVAKFTGVQTIADSLISDNGTLVTIGGNLSVTGSVTLTTPLAVSSGGTGASSASSARTNLGAAASGANSDITSLSGLTTALSVAQGGTGIGTLATNGVIIGNGTSALTSVTAGSAGQCLVSTAGAPTWSACPGASGVSSLNGGNGALTLNNASLSGSTITIQDATTAVKGIASFNSTNLSVTSGVVNTVQNIGTSSAPTFGQLTLTSSQATNPMLLVNNTNGAASGNLIDLQLSGVSKFSVTPAGNLTTSGTITSGTINGQTISSSAVFTGTINGQTISSSANFTGSVAVGTTLSVNTITPSSSLTIGAGGQSFLLQGNASSTLTATNSGSTTTVGFQTPTANVTYNFPTTTAGTYNICTTAGNCAGVGGGVTTPGGTSGKVAKFTASGTIGDSIISDNGTTVTVAGALSVNTITPTSALTVGATGQNLTLQGATVSLSSTASGTTNSLVFATPSGSGKTITIPNATGTVAVSASGPLSMDSAGNLTCPTCLTSGGSGGTSGVSSVNGLTGALTLQGTSASSITNGGTTITINDASSTVKGLASFNATNLTVTSGAVNTVQDIAVTSTPTFGGLNLTAALTVTNGGTGATTAAGARTNLSAAKSGANSDITSLSGLTTALSIAQGGTGIVTTPSNGQLLIGNGSGYSLNTLSAGSGISITNGAGSITISAPGAGTCSGCATTSLNNLASVAINTSLLPSSAAGADLGSGTLPFGQLFLAGTSASPASNNFKITGASTSGTRTITLPDASGTVAVSASGNIALSAAGNITFTGTLGVANGGTGATTLTTNGVLIGNGTSAISAITGSTGQCLLGNTGAAPAFGTCPGSGGVTSLDTLTGVLTINNTSGTGSAITIDNAKADGSTKGIAAFNSSNFQDNGSGVINTIQDIATTSAPTFGQLTVTSSQAANAMMVINNTNVSATGNLIDLKLNGTSKFSVTPSGNTTIAGTLAVNTITPSGSLTVGATSQSFLLQGNGSSTITSRANGHTTTLGFTGGSPTTDPLYQLDSSAATGTYTICTTAANCVGVGGSVSGSGTANRIVKYTATGTVVGNSSILDNGSSLTLDSNVDLLLQGTSAYISNPQGGTNTEAFGLNASTGSGAQNAVAVGAGAFADTASVSVGKSANTGVGGAVAIGNDANANGDASIAIGHVSNTGNFTSSIAIGSDAVSTANNQALIGSTTHGITQFVVGNGVAASTPVGFTLQATSTVGGTSNTAGASITIAGGVGTGSAAGGSINFQIAKPGSSGVSQNTLSTVASISGTNGSALFKNSADSTTAFQVQNAASTALFTVDTSGTTISLQGATTVSANLTVTNAGSLYLQRATDYSTTGTTNDVNLGTASLVRLTGASAQTITGISGGTDGRILTVINAGSNSATISNSSTSSAAANRILTGTAADLTLNPDASMTLVYDAGASRWRVAGAVAGSIAGGNYINNSTSQQAGANFNIAGTGKAANFDATSGALGIGNSVATSVTVGNTTNTTALLFQGAANATYTLGTSNNTGGITLGNSTASNTINIGNATIGAGNTGTINIGTASTGTGKVNVTIGSTNDGSATAIQGGTGNITLSTNSASAKIIAKTGTNAANGFQIQDSSSNAIFNVDTTIGQTTLLATAANEALVIKSAASSTVATAQIKITNSTGSSNLCGIGVNANGDLFLCAGNSTYSSTTGENTGVGAAALSSITTGSWNVAVGTASQTNLTTGYNNVGVGNGSLNQLTVAHDNTAIGTKSFYGVLFTTNNDGNTAIGASAGTLTQPAVSNFYNNTFIGSGSALQDNDNFYTLSNINSSTAIGTGAQVQASNTIVLGKLDGTPTQIVIGNTMPTGTNMFGVSAPIYKAGTASQSGTTITGSGTTWNAANGVKVGMRFVFADGTDGGTITAITNTTHLTVSTSQTVSSQNYRIINTGFQVTNTGDAYVSSTSTTAFLLQDASANTLFTADTTNSTIKVSGTTSTFAILQIDNAHFKSTQTTAPTIGTPTNCATTPTSAVASSSTDAAGSFRITSGTGGGQTTCDTVITFNKAYGAAPKSIMVVPETKDGGTGTAAARQIYVSTSGTTSFTVKMNSPPAGASEVDWFYYWVVE